MWGKVTVFVTGGIAAFKQPLVRLFASRANVEVAMTKVRVNSLRH